MYEVDIKLNVIYRKLIILFYSFKSFLIIFLLLMCLMFCGLLLWTQIGFYSIIGNSLNAAPSRGCLLRLSSPNL